MKLNMKRTIRKYLLLLFGIALLLAGCGKIKTEMNVLRSDLNSLSSRIAAIENSQISILEKKIASLQGEIELLEESDNVKAADIEALQEEADGISEDIAKVKADLTALEGTSTELSSEIETLSGRVSSMSWEVSSIRSRLEALEAKVDATDTDVIITYIPSYADGIEWVKYIRDGLTILRSEISLSYRVYPSSVAETLAKDWKSCLCTRAVNTLSKASSGEIFSIDIISASGEDGILTITLSPTKFDTDFNTGKTEYAVALKASVGGKTVETEYACLAIKSDPLITYLLNTFDTDGDGQLNDMDKATSINLSGYGLSTIDDILVKMPALKELNCSNNSLKSIDLSHNPALTSLNVSNNSLTGLDASKNTALVSLDASNNSLSTIDISKSTALTSLDVSNNSLKALDISKNTALTSLNVLNNALTDLDIWKKTSLSTLKVSTTVILKISDDLQTSVYQLAQAVVIGGVKAVIYNVKSPAIITCDEKTTYNDDYSSWCRQIGTGWSPPSTYVLQKEIYPQISIINATLSAIGATTISLERYWASESCATVDFGNNANTGEGKHAERYKIRAVRSL